MYYATFKKIMETAVDSLLAEGENFAEWFLGNGTYLREPTVRKRLKKILERLQKQYPGLKIESKEPKIGTKFKVPKRLDLRLDLSETFQLYIELKLNRQNKNWSYDEGIVQLLYACKHLQNCPNAFVLLLVFDKFIKTKLDKSDEEFLKEILALSQGKAGILRVYPENGSCCKQWIF